VSRVLTSGLALAPALRRTALTGHARLDGALEPSACRALWREIRTGPLRSMHGTFGRAGVRMEIDGFDVDAPFEGYPVIAELAHAFGALVRERGRGVRGLATWRPNEAGIGVYRPGSVGITAHLDGRWYRRLVAVFTVVGSAAFEVRDGRDGELLDRWGAGPGSLTLLRGPGLGGARDGRPFHAVHGPSRGVRCSLALRFGLRPSAEI
jgi:hypothetical protein